MANLLAALLALFSIEHFDDASDTEHHASDTISSALLARCADAKRHTTGCLDFELRCEAYAL